MIPHWPSVPRRHCRPGTYLFCFFVNETSSCRRPATCIGGRLPALPRCPPVAYRRHLEPSPGTWPICWRRISLCHRWRTSRSLPDSLWTRLLRTCSRTGGCTTVEAGWWCLVWTSYQGPVSWTPALKLDSLWKNDIIFVRLFIGYYRHDSYYTWNRPSIILIHPPPPLRTPTFSESELPKH